ncbi:MAG: hypothetical protein RL404_2657 [Pseudomonadota bacterium]
MFKQACFSFIAALWLAMPASAGALQEPAAPLTLAQAQRLAREGSPTLSAARREVEATEGQVLQGSLRPNPEFVFQADDTSRLSRTSSAQLDVPVETANKREARVEAAERSRDVAQTDFADRGQRLRAAVSAAFFDVLAAQELLRAAQEGLNLARRATDVASRRVTAGKVSPVEETKARVAEAGARVALTQAESGLRNARTRLSSLWGNPLPQFTLAEGSIDRLPDLPDGIAIEQRLQDAPALLRAERELRRRKALVGVEQSRTVPNFTVSVGMKRREDTVGRDQLLVGVSVPLQMFNRNQGNLLEALRREDKARDELQAVRTSVAADAYQALEKANARRHEVELLQRDVLPGARSAYEAATIGFENGKFSFLELLDAQRTLFTATAQYLAAIAAVHAALAELDGILGTVDSL